MMYQHVMRIAQGLRALAIVRRLELAQPDGFAGDHVDVPAVGFGVSGLFFAIDKYRPQLWRPITDLAT
jgi:hypothetical protein